jgi:hypothetical protein
MDIFKIKKGDQNPAIGVTLQYSDATPIDLTNGSVWFIMGNLTNYSAYTSGQCVITGSATGECEYRWTGTIDTGSVGTYWGEFEMQWTGSKMTLPSDHSLQIQVYEDYN